MSSADGARDLRSWLSEVEALGELQHVSGAHWDHEIGAISELNYRRVPPAAMLFDDIPGYARGLRVLTGSISNARRTALALGFGPDVDDARLVDQLRGKPTEWENGAADFTPTVVERGPVLENRVAGGDVDLFRFPVPRWHELDGGRYIGTGCTVFTTDPATGAVNGGAYRMQVQDEGRTATVNAVPGKHGDQHIRKWFAKAGRAPITVSLGHDPLLLILGGIEVPAGISELDYAGAVLGRPVDVIRGTETGLPIPAGSEIAIEGWLHPGDTRPEGPLGEWNGYYSGSQHPVLALTIENLYFRDDPILLGSPPSKPPHDYSYMRTVMKSAMAFDALVKAGVPGVAGVWAHESGGGRLLLVVSIRQAYCGHSRQAAYIAAQCQATAYMNRYVVVVDDDIDPTNLDDVVWAICTRSDPGVDIEIMRKTWGSRTDPLLEDPGRPYNSRAIIDACWPFERLADFPVVAQSAPDYLRAIRDKWGSVFSDSRFALPANAIPATDRGARSASQATAMTDM
jgi:UbiD family decarboxylase